MKFFKLSFHHIYIYIYIYILSVQLWKAESRQDAEIKPCKSAWRRSCRINVFSAVRYVYYRTDRMTYLVVRNVNSDVKKYYNMNILSINTGMLISL